MNNVNWCLVPCKCIFSSSPLSVSLYSICYAFVSRQGESKKVVRSWAKEIKETPCKMSQVMTDDDRENIHKRWKVLTKRITERIFLSSTMRLEKIKKQRKTKEIREREKERKRGDDWINRVFGISYVSRDNKSSEAGSQWTWTIEQPIHGKRSSDKKKEWHFSSDSCVNIRNATLPTAKTSSLSVSYVLVACMALRTKNSKTRRRSEHKTTKVEETHTRKKERKKVLCRCCYRGKKKNQAKDG